MCPQSKCYEVFGYEVCLYCISILLPGVHELLLHLKSCSIYSNVFFGHEPSSTVVTGTLYGYFSGDLTRPFF